MARRSIPPLAPARAGDVLIASPPPVPPAFAAVIPMPLAATAAQGSFTLSPATRILVRSAAPEAMRVAESLASHLRPATGYRLPVSRATGAADVPGSIVLVLATSGRPRGDEGYRLQVSPDRVTVTAGRAAGLFWAVQTLRQLLPAAIELTSRQPGPWRIRAGTIEDRPRFPWRGAMLDVARHFLGVGDVKRFIDLMALYKLNRLHLHLSDDQGWRIAVRSWPRLTTHGGRTAVGGGPGGYYSRRQYAEIVAYAQSRFITVVPEIDMPGHTNAALASYGKLTCNGVAPALYTGIEVGFSSLCLGKDVTYAFVSDVIREVAALTPGPYVHIGGDEALATDLSDYVPFIERVQRIVRAEGKRMIGWEETARVKLHRSSVVQHWHDPALARQAVARGAKVIMSPATKAYLDMKYGPETPLGLQWAGFTDVRDAYAWDPATQVPGVAESDILGVEAALWSETTDSLADVELLAFPRLIGHAEIAWSPVEGRSWRRYRSRLGAQGPRLRALGVGYYRSEAIPWR